MSFEVRCPECRAKLRLDDEPAADEAIECPRCGNHLDPTAARVAADGAPKKKKKGAGPAVADKPGREKTALKEKKPAREKAAAAKPDDNAPKKKRARKQKSNRTILALMLGGALVILACIGGMAYFLFSTAGKQEEMLAHVPGDCNWVRGVNAGHIGKYAGYRSELDRAMGGPLGDTWVNLAQSLGFSEADGATPEYAVMGKVKDGAKTGTVYVYRTRKAFDPKALGAALGGTEGQSGGQTYYQLPSKNGPLNRAAVYAPSDRLIVVVGAGSQQNDLLQKSVAGKANPDASFWGKMGKTGRKVSAGSVWVLVRADGDLRNYIKELVKPVESDFKQLSDQAAKSPIFGMWTSFGSKITFGAGLQCGSAEEASALADFFRESPLGSGDETVEPPNSLKQAYSNYKSKEMSEFRSNLKFKSDGDCAYLESRMGQRDKANQALQTFANPNIGDSSGSTSGFGPQGGGPFGPQGGPRGMGAGGPGGP